MGSIILILHVYAGDFVVIINNKEVISVVQRINKCSYEIY